MGVAVSGWALARTVSKLGQLGVVSGTGLAMILLRGLQVGDPQGHLRRALQHFPVPSVAQRVVEKYYIPEGKPADEPFKLSQMPTLHPNADTVDLMVTANFVEVFLAKEGHNGLVGINLLEKIQLPTLPSLYGAMLAGVDYVLMGAGIPRSIPGTLDDLARGRPTQLRMTVEGALPGEEFLSRFDPQQIWQGPAPDLPRPHFLGIISSSTLAMTLAKKSNGRVDGFVVEGDTAGGHNAPPRGPLQLNTSGEPIYGPRDVPDLKAIGELGLPFWLAGSYGRPGKLAEALQRGATGIQVGTAFAFCDESGISPDLKQQVIQMSRANLARVFTDPVASPTGFPFKVVQAGGTLSEAAVYDGRTRICDLGYLRHLYRKADGSVGYRCPAEPVHDYLRKGGAAADAQGKKCLCNSLVANVGYGQIRSNNVTELPLLTAGDDLADIARFLKPGRDTYSAIDVLEQLLSPAPATCLETATLG